MKKHTLGMLSLVLSVACAPTAPISPGTQNPSATIGQPLVNTSAEKPAGSPPSLTLSTPISDFQNELSGASSGRQSLSNQSVASGWQFGPYLFDANVKAGEKYQLNYSRTGSEPVYAHLWYYSSSRNQWEGIGWRYNPQNLSSYSETLTVPANAIGIYIGFFSDRGSAVNATLELSSGNSPTIPSDVQAKFQAAIQRAGGKLGSTTGGIVRAGSASAYKQEFSNGMILLKDGAASAYFMHGNIWRAWLNKGNTERLGLPIGDVATGNTLNGQSSEYQQYDKAGDPSLHSWSGGTYIFLSGIRNAWQTYKDRLGHPSNDEINGTQTFQNGSISWNNGNPQVWVNGQLISGSSGVNNSCFYHAVGDPPGSYSGYTNAQGFQEYYLRMDGKNYGWHLGDDLNGSDGSDFRDPVYSIGFGQVTEAKDFGSGWGNIVFVKHNLNGREYTSMYAHLDQIKVTKGQLISAKQQVGTIGTAHGAYSAHLHLEIREGNTMSAGRAYTQTKVSKGPENQINAMNLIKANLCK